MGNAVEEGGGKAFITAGTILGTCGVGLIITGSVCSPSAGRAKIRKAVNLYNNGRMYSESELELEYGLTDNGVYMTFRF